MACLLYLIFTFFLLSCISRKNRAKIGTAQKKEIENAKKQILVKIA